MTSGLDDSNSIKLNMGKLFDMFPNSRRHKRVVDNSNWNNVILPAIHEFVIRSEQNYFEDLELSFWDVSMILVEIIYVLGYEE